MASIALYGLGRPVLDFSPRLKQPSNTTVTIINRVEPVTPKLEPKIDANQLYGRNMVLFAGGSARIGSASAPIVGPYLDQVNKKVDLIVSFGVPANVDGDRKIYKIYLDNEEAWSSVGGGTLPADGTFAAESFDFVFQPGTLTQGVCSLEADKSSAGDACAYRPQMLMQIRNLPYARFMEKSGKPVPYVSCDIGDVTDGANPADGINLGEALARIAHSPWAGYTPATFEAVGITDVVDAILIAENFTVIQLCQSVIREYRNIDLLVSDKTRVKDRGSTVAPSFIFNRSSIISGDDAIVVSRAGATEQRREHELIAIDPAQDYTPVSSLAQIPRNPMVISAAVGKETLTVPLVIDASTRQALATFSQQYEENARRQIALKVPAFGYRIEPGDLFAITDIAEGVDNEVFKCTQTTHGANWMVDIEGEAILRCSIFGDEASVIFIDFLASSTGRAWVDGVEVPPDTLLGTDANTVTAWGATEFDSANNTADGYVQGGLPMAFIGAALDRIVAGCTMRIQYKGGNGETDIVDPFVFVSSTSTVPGLQVHGDYLGATHLRVESWATSSFVADSAIFNTLPGDKNCLALTVTATRLEVAVNGSSSINELSLDADDRPSAHPLVAALADFSASGSAIQTITIYGPLATTDGLADLSESV